MYKHVIWKKKTRLGAEASLVGGADGPWGGGAVAPQRGPNSVPEYS